MGEREEAPYGGRSRVPDPQSFERLERLVHDLVERHLALRNECSTLRRTLAERDARLRSMDARVRDLNQSRQDAVKRLDDLITQLARVEEQIERRQGPRAEAS
jgi:chromosome segregation ATPase